MNNSKQKGPAPAGRGTFSGSLAFILAAAGSAVGLGNIWKFPYITGVHGGGAFVLVYLVCIAVVGLPLLTSEMVLGRRSAKEAVGMFLKLTQAARGGRLWSAFGWLAVVTAFVLLSYYSVVGGWTLAYAFKSVSGGLTSNSSTDMSQIFGAFVSDGGAQVLWHGIFMLATMGIVIGGVKGGLELAAKILMPLLGALMLILLFRSLSLEGSGRAMEFLFSPAFDKLTPGGVLEALGHAFFTLSLGMGAMVVYGSYLGPHESIFKAALAVAFVDTAVALAAGVMIFGVVFSAGLEPSAGPSLVFQTMPLLLEQMPGGTVWTLMFFLLVAFAALTSSIAILEVVVAHFVDERGMGRRQATLMFGGAIFLLGLLPALSNGGALGDVKLVGDRNIFDSFDYLVSNWALPLGGLGVALFTGWVVEQSALKDDLKEDSMAKSIYHFWMFCTRFVAPAAVILVILHATGVV